MPALEDYIIFDFSRNDEDDGAMADMNNLDTTIQIEAMQEELLQFKLQDVWTLVYLPNGKRAIGTKSRLSYKYTRVDNHCKDYIKALELVVTLSTYLLDNGFQRGKIDKTLFIKRHKGDILLVQVYVGDIIFGSTKKELCIAFEKLMLEKFQMSSMGELSILLGITSEAEEG
ncbi:ribonuclease H-like domain-containing protein [Tanacetum coccineum]